MKKSWYASWKQVRLKRIIEVLGKSWFEDKNILELGCAHGDIGLELSNLGADVTFADGRQDHLNTIILNHPQAKTHLIDQNDYYNLIYKYDLILHLGTLYHLKNWEKDLSCALSHSDLMILETRVYPFDLKKPFIYTDDYFDYDNPYNGLDNSFGVFDEKFLLKQLDSLGCKWIQLDIPEMTTPALLEDDYTYIKHIYGWDPKSKDIKEEISYPTKNIINHYRRMYLIIK